MFGHLDACTCSLHAAIRGRLLAKWCDVADQFRCVSVRGPDVAARATVVVNEGVSHRQKTDDFTIARWTLRDYCHRSNRRTSRPTSERILRRRFSMTKRNAHASQHRYAKLLAWANSRTRAAPHFGQGVTGRPPWSLGLGMSTSRDGSVSRTERAS